MGGVAISKNILEQINDISSYQFDSIEELYKSSTSIHQMEDVSNEEFCRVTNIYAICFLDKNGDEKVFSYCRRETAVFDMQGSIVDFVPYEVYSIES